jgi:hypothetical protein
MALEGWQELCGHLPNGKGAPFLARLPRWDDKAPNIPRDELVLFGSRQRIREGDMMEMDRLRL